MQVSWIEPDQLRDLVGQLQRPAAPANTVAYELHTLPNPAGLGARELGIEDGDLWLPDEESHAAVQAAPVIAPVEELFSPAAGIAEQAPVGPSEEAREEVPAPPAQAEELNRIREKLQAIRERAIDAGLLAHVQAAEEVPSPQNLAPVAKPEPPQSPPISQSNPLGPTESPFAVAETTGAPLPTVVTSDVTSFEVSSGMVSERLEAFATWAGLNLGLRDLLVVDDHGDILWGIHEQAGLVVSAMMACKATLRSSALGATEPSNIIEQPISIDRMLVIVPCETSYGSLSIAFVRDGVFPEAAALLLRKALTVAIEGTMGSGFPAPHAGTALD